MHGWWGMSHAGERTAAQKTGLKTAALSSLGLLAYFGLDTGWKKSNPSSMHSTKHTHKNGFSTDRYSRGFFLFRLTRGRGRECVLATRVDDLNEFRLQARPAHQKSINVLLPRQFLAVLPGHWTCTWCNGRKMSRPQSQCHKRKNSPPKWVAIQSITLPPLHYVLWKCCIIPLCWVTFCIHWGIISVGQFSRKCAKSINQA